MNFQDELNSLKKRTVTKMVPIEIVAHDMANKILADLRVAASKCDVNTKLQYERYIQCPFVEKTEELGNVGLISRRKNVRRHTPDAVAMRKFQEVLHDDLARYRIEVKEYCRAHNGEDDLYQHAYADYCSSSCSIGSYSVPVTRHFVLCEVAPCAPWFFETIAQFRQFDHFAPYETSASDSFIMQNGKRFGSVYTEMFLKVVYFEV